MNTLPVFALVFSLQDYKMGQCCVRESTCKKDGCEENDGSKTYSAKSLGSVDPIPIEDQHHHVRLLAGVVLSALQESLNEFEKYPQMKEIDKYDAEWVHWMDRIVQQLKSEFNPLMDQMRSHTDQSKSDTTYLISRKKIDELGLQSYPKHEEAIKMGLLKEVEIDDMRMKLCREFNRGIHTHFISHKWDGNSPDTADNAIFEMTKSAAHYIWFDYTCVPQDDHFLRLRHLLSIADICNEATVVCFHANADLEKSYNSSVWCQLEAALLQWDNVVFDTEMEWTIYDWNDLYAVLPGFLDLWVNSHKNNHFFLGKEGFARTSMIVSMLKAFIAFHDSKDDNEII